MNSRIEPVRVGDRTLLVYPDRPGSLYEALVRTAERVPDRMALSAETGSRTYGQLKRRGDELSAYLAHSLAIRKGERIGLLFPNTMLFCELMLASGRVGAIAVLLNAKLTAHEQQFILRHSGCTALVYDPEFEDKAAQLRPHLPELRFIRADALECLPADLPASSTAARGSAAMPVVSEGDPCFLMYTSGTTGVPKGALLTHRNVIHSALNYAHVCGTTADDRTLIAIPLFHVTGLIGQFLHMMMVGGTSVLLREYSTAAFLSAAIRERVTMMFNVPAIYNLMLLKKETEQITTLRLALYGGAPMPPETIRKLRAMFPGLALLNAYGATETSSPATLMRPGWPEDKIRSVGRAVPGAHLIVADESGRALPPGVTGELWISGAMVIERYWENESANKESFAGPYWKSGDMAMIDEDGYVYILDRKKDVINRGGEKIYSVEIEALLAAHPGIADAAVVGVPDDIFGERVKAFVVPKDGAALSAEGIRTYVGEHFAPFKVPQEVSFVEAIPRNPGGKIMKRLLREKGEEGIAAWRSGVPAERSDAG